MQLTNLFITYLLFCISDGSESSSRRHLSGYSWWTAHMFLSLPIL